jgi:hypothetical protein
MTAISNSKGDMSPTFQGIEVDDDFDFESFFENPPESNQIAFQLVDVSDEAIRRLDEEVALIHQEAVDNTQRVIDEQIKHNACMRRMAAKFLVKITKLRRVIQNETKIKRIVKKFLLSDTLQRAALERWRQVGVTYDRVDEMRRNGNFVTWGLTVQTRAQKLVAKMRASTPLAIWRRKYKSRAQAGAQ